MLASLHKLFHIILISPLNKCWLFSLLKAEYSANLSTALCPDSKACISVAFYLYIYLGMVPPTPASQSLSLPFTFTPHSPTFSLS